MKRSRGRGGRRPQSNSGGNGNNPNRTYDSNGPEVKIRGSAAHVYEKYLQLARDTNASGDRVMAENYLQHAEHYYRILAANNQLQQQYQAQQAQYHANGNGRFPGAPPVEGNAAQPYSGSDPSFSLSEEEEEAERTAEG